MMHAAPLQAHHREAWDALVASHPASGFMQSWGWSDFKALEGYTVVRLGLFAKETLCGGAVAYTFPSLAEAGLAVMPDGPVLDWEAPGASAEFRALVSAFRNSAAGRRVVALRVEPRLEAAPELLRDLPRAPVDLVPDETLLVDLGPEPEMLARMKPKGRYNARLASRRGVEVVSSVDPTDVHEFHFILEQTARYQDFRLEPKRPRNPQTIFALLVPPRAAGLPRGRLVPVAVVCGSKPAARRRPQAAGTRSAGAVPGRPRCCGGPAFRGAVPRAKTSAAKL
jgi:hypothetical protein